MSEVKFVSSVIFWLERNSENDPYGAVLERLRAQIVVCSSGQWPERQIPAAFVLRGRRESILDDLQRIRRASGFISSTPVLLLSPDCLESDLGDERWSKGVDFLREPVAPGLLARRLNFFADIFNWSEELIPLRSRELTERDREVTHSRFLDSLIENLPHMVFVKDATNLKFVRINRAGEDLLGIPRGELLGKSDFDFFPTEQARQFVEKDRAVLAGDRSVEITSEGIQTKSQGVRQLRTKKIPIFGPDGQPAYLLGISEDITEMVRKDQERLELTREQALLAARESVNERTMFLADASMILTSSFDYRRSFRMLTDLLSPAFCDYSAVYLTNKNSRAELVSVRGEFFHKFSEAFAALHADFLRHRRPEDFVAEEKKSIFLAEAGISGMRSFLAVPVQVRGEVLGVVLAATAEGGRAFDAQDYSTAEELGRRAGIALDNAQLYETAQKAIQARDEFLSIASHELKTPMTSLKLQVQMTRRMVDPSQNKVPAADRLAKVLDISAVQVDRLNALVDDLLDVSRIESGKLTYEFEPVEIGLLIREMVERYFEHLRSAGCQVSVATRGISWVKGDRFRLEQVVLNLLSNAAKYGRGQPVELKVENADGVAVITMRDQGMGIAPDMVEKIFERFERASPTDHIGGLGLGLYICREIVRAHGGSINVESELGRGSCFRVELPLMAEKMEVAAQVKPVDGKQPQSYSPLPTRPEGKSAPLELRP